MWREPVIMIIKSILTLFLIILPYSIAYCDSSKVYLGLGNNSSTYVLIAEKQEPDYIDLLGMWIPFMFYEIEGPGYVTMPEIVIDEQKNQRRMDFTISVRDGDLVSGTKRTRYSGFFAGELDQTSVFYRYVEKTEDGYILRYISSSGAVFEEYRVFTNQDFSWFAQNIDVARNTTFKFREAPMGKIDFSGVHRY